MNLNFNLKKPDTIHVDINSCFATLEQQANPHLRGKLVAVAAYTTSSGCILASSVEAKKKGIKTGMRVSEAKVIDPNLVVLSPDPDKYRFVHQGLKKILLKYSFKVTPKSIDEFCFKPAMEDPYLCSLKVKEDIKSSLGEHITVSVGISTNRYLAKIAAGLVKPNGLITIDSHNHPLIYKSLELTDLCGIKRQNKLRLNRVGIYSVWDFYNAPLLKLKIAFGGIVGYYWFLRLRGYEIDDFKSNRKTFGNSFAPPPNLSLNYKEILSNLCFKTAYRLRKAGLKAKGVHLSLLYRQGYFWHKSKLSLKHLTSFVDIYEECLLLLKEALNKFKGNIRIMAIDVFELSSLNSLQLTIFEDLVKKEKLNFSLNALNQRWGNLTIFPARGLYTKDKILDRISFGKVDL